MGVRHGCRLHSTTTANERRTYGTTDTTTRTRRPEIVKRWQRRLYAASRGGAVMRVQPLPRSSIQPPNETNRNGLKQVENSENFFLTRTQQSPNIEIAGKKNGKKKGKIKTGETRSKAMTHSTGGARAKDKDKFAHHDKRGRRSDVRPDLHLTALAEEVGVGPDYLSKLFRGIGTPSVPLAIKLAGAMKIPLEKLLMDLQEQRDAREAEKAQRKSQRARKRK